MATEDADDPGDGRLLAAYRRHVGEPEREIDVYLGFALFFGGIALSAVGLVVFLAGATLPPADRLFWQLREIAIALSAGGLPAFLLSVVVLLPVRRRATHAGLVGLAVSLVAIGVFVAVYPHNWNVTTGADYSAQGIAVYGLGLAILVAADGTALVAYHLERAHPTPSDDAGTTETEESTAPATGNGSAAETVTRAQVERDIEEAIESTEITWGGVEKSGTKRISIETDAEASIDRSGFDPDQANTARGGSVDDAVAGLRQLQGGERETGTGEGVDDQTAALRELKEQQRRAAEREPDSVVERMRERIGL